MMSLSAAVLAAAVLLEAHSAQEPQGHLLAVMSLCHGALADLGEALAAPEAVLEVVLEEVSVGDAAVAGVAASAKPPTTRSLKT